MKYVQLLLLAIFSFIGQNTQCAQARSKAKQDHYAVLGVPRTASKADIKRAFREKSLQYHPDRNEGDEEALKEAREEMVKINAAYAVLNDKDKRGAYDRGGDEEVEHIEKQQAQDNYAPAQNNAAGNNDHQDDASYTIQVTEKFGSFWQQVLHGRVHLSKNRVEHLSNQSLEALRTANPKKSLIIALVPTEPTAAADGFGIPGVHIYEAHRFNDFISHDQNHETADQDGPRGEVLRSPFANPRDQRIEVAEPCYIELAPDAEQFTYLCSLSELTKDGPGGEILRERFQAAYDQLNHANEQGNGNGQNFNYEEKVTRIACNNVPLINFPFPATLKPTFKSYAKDLCIGMLIALVNGLVNNYAGRKYNEANTSFIHAPWREWRTGALAMLFSRSYVDRRFAAQVGLSGNTIKYSALKSLLVTSAQMFGEVVPLSKTYSSWRDVSLNSGIIPAAFNGFMWTIFG